MRRNYREYATRDKSGWGEGPWQDEPDKVQWIDEETELDCLIRRSPGGAWCGYVGVGPEHPWYGLDYSGGCVNDPKCEESWCGHSPVSLVDVHGGLTFSESCAEIMSEAEGICHVAELGRPDHVWWFGFDCGHYADLAPDFARRFPDLASAFGEQTYRDRAYVETEVVALARQIARVASSAR
jgi:hypothetical protein